MLTLEKIMQPRQYNYIYSKLVEDNNDIIGLLAYSIYKEKKIQYIEDFKERIQQEPTDEDLAEFNRSSLLNFDLYRKNAEVQINEIYDAIFQSQLEEFRKVQKEEQEKALQSLCPSVFTHIIAGVIGGVSYTLFLVILFAILGMSGVDVLQFIMNILQQTN